jgi:hypothetical protein
MAQFTWTAFGGGDWAAGGNWSGNDIPPPGVGDFAGLGSQASPYTVTVNVGEIANAGNIQFIGDALTGASLSISGTMTTDWIQYLTTGPATSVTINCNRCGQSTLATRPA